VTLTTVIRYPMGNDFNRPHEHPTVNLPDHLDLIAAAPDGIQKLRGLILELAVRGKLVPQDPNDEPASELLKRIAKERTRLEAEGAGRKSKATPLVGEDEQPFALPNGWAWVRLGQIGDWGAGATPLRSNFRYYGGTIPWFKSGELTADFISDAEEHVTELALKECSLRQNRAGDVLIAMYGATIGKTAILAKAATTNQAVCACTPNTGVFNRYLLTLLKGLKPNFIGQGAGGAQPNISREKIIATVTALPPEAEQHRIVAKVDELMALCDRLEAEQADAGVAHARLVETLLGTLTQSADAAELAANWQRLAEHFDTLFTTESSLDALKQTILQLAVMGKLVPQDPNDEPASELLKRIAKERARLESEGMVKRSKTLPPVGHNEEPFPLPNGWIWERIGNYVLQTDYGLSEKTFEATEGVPVLKMGDIQAGEVMLGNQKKVPSTTEGLPFLLLKPDDLLYNRTNSAELVGKTGIFRGPRLQYSFASYLIRIRCANYLISAYFLNMAMNAPLFRETEISPHLKQQCGQANVNGTILRNMKVPVPPAAEQHRIVAKVDELMALCDRLKADLAEARTQQERLATTLIESALNAA